MIPLEKVREVVMKHDSLEKELSTGTIDSKTFAKKSKEYSNLGNIISYARSYLKFDEEKTELEQILQDKSSDTEMSSLAEKELEILKQKNGPNLFDVGNFHDLAKKMYKHFKNPKILIDQNKNHMMNLYRFDKKRIISKYNSLFKKI